MRTYEKSCLGKRRMTKKWAKITAARLARREGVPVDWYRCQFCVAAGELDHYHGWQAQPEDGMKLFEGYLPHEMRAHVAAGGQAPEIWDKSFTYAPTAPRCFRGRDFVKLYDADEVRLVATARRLGVRVVKVDRPGTSSQHVAKSQDRRTRLGYAHSRFKGRPCSGFYAAMMTLKDFGYVYAVGRRPRVYRITRKALEDRGPISAVWPIRGRDAEALLLSGYRKRWQAEAGGPPALSAVFAERLPDHAPDRNRQWRR